jgi:hypothetical protein
VNGTRELVATWKISVAVFFAAVLVYILWPAQYRNDAEEGLPSLPSFKAAWVLQGGSGVMSLICHNGKVGVSLDSFLIEDVDRTELRSKATVKTVVMVNSKMIYDSEGEFYRGQGRDRIWIADLPDKAIGQLGQFAQTGRAGVISISAMERGFYFQMNLGAESLAKFLSDCDAAKQEE